MSFPCNGDTLKVGDKVFSLLHGWVTIREIKNPLIKSTTGYTWAWSGSVFIGGTPDLYWDIPTIIAPNPPQEAREETIYLNIYPDDSCGKHNCPFDVFLHKTEESANFSILPHACCPPVEVKFTRLVPREPVDK